MQTGFINNLTKLLCHQRAQWFGFRFLDLVHPSGYNATALCSQISLLK